MLNYNLVLINRNLNLDLLEKLNVKYIISNTLSSRDDLTEDFIERTIYKLPYDFKILTNRVTSKFIIKYPELPWCWDIIHYNEDFSLDIIKKYPKKNYSLNEIAVINKIDFSQLPSVAHLHWDWNLLSRYISIDFTTYQQLKDKPWNLSALADRGVISHQYLDNLLGLNQWNELEKIYIKYQTMFSFNIYRNPNISERYVEMVINKYMSTKELPKTNQIKVDFFKCISSNQNITPYIVKKYFDFNWDYQRLLKNIKLNRNQVLSFCILMSTKIPRKKFYKLLSRNKNWNEDWLNLPNSRWDINYLGKYQYSEKIKQAYPNVPWYKIRRESNIKINNKDDELSFHKRAMDALRQKHYSLERIYNISLCSNRYLTLDILEKPEKINLY